jgi:hypothetical protein
MSEALDWTQDGMSGFDEKVVNASGAAKKWGLRYEDNTNTFWTKNNHYLADTFAELRALPLVQVYERTHNPKYATPAPAPEKCKWCGQPLDGSGDWVPADGHGKDVCADTEHPDYRAPFTPASVPVEEGFEAWWEKRTSRDANYRPVAEEDSAREAWNAALASRTDGRKR